MSTATYFFIFLAALVALAVAFFQYYHKEKSRGKIFWVFPFFRFISVFSLLLLLIDPQIRIIDYYTEKPNLVIAVDNSASIKYSGSAEEVSAFVNEISQNKRLQERFNIEIFSFGEELNRTDSLDFSQSQTNISEALHSLNQLYRNSVAPTILITDGNQTFGENPVFATRNFGQSIFPVVVGDTTSYQDLFISKINVNKYAFLKNNFPVEIILNYSGKEKVDSKLEIKTGASVILSKEISFEKGKNSKIVQMILPASKVGVGTYEAKIFPLKSEKNIHNNSQNFAVEVVDEQTSVLLASSIIHPDLGALKKAVESNKQRKLTYYEFRNALPEINDYELVIIYQPDQNFKLLFEEILKQKKHFWIITGPKTDWNFLNSAQDLFKKEITFQEENYFPVANSGYAAFQFENIGFENFPPLEASFGSINFLKSADIILYKKVSGMETEEPLLATFNDGASKKGILTGANIWKWRSQVFQENGSFEKFNDFIGNLIQYLAENQKKDHLLVKSEPFYYGNQNIEISAQYFDANYQFDPRAQLKLNLVNETSGEKTTFPLLLKGNHYGIELDKLPAAEYSFSVAVTGENNSKRGKFNVLDFDVEQQFFTSDLEGLKSIAKQHEAEVYFLKKPENLVNELLSGNKFFPVQKSQKKDVSLVEWYILLGLIILSLSAEWFLRKYHGLI